MCEVKAALGGFLEQGARYFDIPQANGSDIKILLQIGNVSVDVEAGDVAQSFGRKRKI